MNPSNRHRTKPVFNGLLAALAAAPLAGTLAALALLLLATGGSPTASAQTPAGEPRGGLVLSFDDGDRCWLGTIAPELKSVGGTATGYVNNLRVQAGKLSYADLLALQKQFGWEIGTHTWHHHSAPEFVRARGLPSWLGGELEAALADLGAQGLDARSLAFPFNASTPEIAAAALRLVESYRRSDPSPLAAGAGPDGSIPGLSIDFSHYIPPAHLRRWIDLAHEEDRLLFLYGHRVLPDEAFVTGRVAAVEAGRLTAEGPIGALSETDLCLVPDLAGPVKSPIPVERIEGNVVQIGRGDISRLTRPGASFLVGPRYAVSLGYFRELIGYAAGKVPFYTTRQAVARGRPAGSTGSVESSPRTGR